MRAEKNVSMINVMPFMLIKSFHTLLSEFHTKKQDVLKT